MNVPYRWLKDYVSTDLPVDELARRMTMAGLEAEQLTRFGDAWKNVFVGEVLSVTQHPDADRLVLADVQAGQHRLTVVTGATNIAAGQKVALALAGARLIDAYTDGLKYKTLKPGNIRGIRSEGMVCSEKELGLSDEHEGILVLEESAPVGTPLADFLGDTVIEFEITPNLVHAFSVFGIAREAGAVTASSVRNPDLADLSNVPDAPGLVTIDAPDLCKRYTAVIMDGLRVAPSPPWLSRRLQAAGVRPVSNLVDVTNYVMLELGQPMHAFDLTYIEGEQIVVRLAHENEPFETLDHRKRELQASDLLICDAARPIGIAGVMGGVNSEITDTTTSILIESANFDMVSVRRSARQHKLQTDASARFGRGLDPELCETAAARAVALFLELCPGSTVRARADVYPNPESLRTITFPTARVASLLGMTIAPETMQDALERLGFAPTVSVKEISVTVPSWRSDVKVYQDVIEEVARIVGYDQLPATLIVGTSPHVERDATYLAERQVRAHLVAAGLFEGRGYVTYSPADAERWSLTTDGLAHTISDGSHVTLRNAIPAEHTLMRTTIVPNLVSSVLENLKHERSVRLFEVGHVYLPTTSNELPNEPSTVAVAMSGRRMPFDRFAPKASEGDLLDYFDAKGLVDSLIAPFLGSDVEWEAFSHPALHPGRSAMLQRAGVRLGIVAEVHPALAADLGFEHRVAIAELNLARILELRDAQAARDVNVPRYLPVEQDFAVVVEQSTPAVRVQEAISASSGPLLSGITLFDVFEGPSIGEGKKSLAYRLTFTAPDRALTDAELGKVRKRLERELAKQVGGTLRA